MASTPAANPPPVKREVDPKKVLEGLQNQAEQTPATEAVDPKKEEIVDPMKVDMKDFPFELIEKHPMLKDVSAGFVILQEAERRREAEKIAAERAEREKKEKDEEERIRKYIDIAFGLARSNLNNLPKEVEQSEGVSSMKQELEDLAQQADSGTISMRDLEGPVNRIAVRSSALREDDIKKRRDMMKRNANAAEVHQIVAASQQALYRQSAQQTQPVQPVEPVYSRKQEVPVYQGRAFSLQAPAFGVSDGPGWSVM